MTVINALYGVQYFIWCSINALYGSVRSSSVKNYKGFCKDFARELDFKDIKFPFSQNLETNSLALVFLVRKTSKNIQCMCQEKLSKNIYLLFIGEESKSHHTFFFIRKLFYNFFSLNFFNIMLKIRLRFS